jgi:hypothetical protein
MAPVLIAAAPQQLAALREIVNGLIVYRDPRRSLDAERLATAVYGGTLGVALARTQTACVHIVRTTAGAPVSVRWSADGVSQAGADGHVLGVTRSVAAAGAE